MTDHTKPETVTPIVSSEHLTSPGSWQLSEFEYGLVLRNVNHRQREKRGAMDQESAEMRQAAALT